MSTDPPTPDRRPATPSDVQVLAAGPCRTLVTVTGHLDLHAAHHLADALRPLLGHDGHPSPDAAPP